MKLTIVLGAAGGYELGLNAVVGVIKETLDELGEEVELLNLSEAEIPFYSGRPCAPADEIMKKIAASDGVAFAATTVMNAPCALMQSFLEYFTPAARANILKDKNCLIVTTGRNGGERATIEYLSGVIGRLGGFDAVRICAEARDCENLHSGSELKEIIERQTEDFYRILRQNRKFIIPRYSDGYVEDTEADTDYEPSDGRKAYVNIEELYAKHNYEPDSNSSDINELANLYAQKYLKTKSGITQTSVEPVARSFKKSEAVKPRTKNCKQLAQTLPHHFNPQAAAGIRAVFQLSISGSEGFEGCISIDNDDCNFTDGPPESSDIVIMADDKVWTDIMKGKYTAQKAFMVGKLKVRGNFMLLTKYDTLFSKIL